MLLMDIWIEYHDGRRASVYITKGILRQFKQKQQAELLDHHSRNTMLVNAYRCSSNHDGY
jgi:hypothetical protein